MGTFSMISILQMRLTDGGFMKLFPESWNWEGAELGCGPRLAGARASSWIPLAA